MDTCVICIYVRTYVGITYTYICMCMVCIHKCVHLHMYISVHIRYYVYLRTYVRTYVHLHMYIFSVTVLQVQAVQYMHPDIHTQVYAVKFKASNTCRSCFKL